MSSVLETRLAETFAALPGPSPEVEERALGAAIAALPPSPRRHPLRALVAGVALAALLAAGAAALAAIGTIHLDAKETRAPGAPARLVLPVGATAIAVVAGGRLWLTSRGGTRIEALPVGAAELSPHGLYVGVGIGRALVAMSPAGERAWTHVAAGPVEQIAWAPDGLRIAYVVRAATGLQLRTIEGDGDHDRLVASSVRNVRPSWRADSLALAYVGAGGRPLVYDLAHRSRRVAGGSCGGGDGIRALAFAPSGRRLAYAGTTTVGVDGAAGCVRYENVIRLTGLAWTGRRSFVTSERSTVDAPSALRSFALRGGTVVATGAALGDSGVAAVAAAPGTLVLARDGAIVRAERPKPGEWPLRTDATLLRVPARGRVAVSVR